MSSTSPALEIQPEVPVKRPDGVPRYELPLWRDRYGWIAGITSRGNGFNLGLGTQEGANAVTDRWRTVRETTEGAFAGIVVGRQVHGTEVRHHESRFRGLLVLEEVDGHVTLLPGLLLAVTVADCIPVYLGVPQAGAIALLHAGWRGTAAGILERGVARLCDVAGVPPSDVVMHLGVGICGECYEVGPEVFARLGCTAGDEAAPSSARSAALLDLRAVLAERARALGVPNPTVSSWCTSHDVDRFFSHRADRGNAGRMAAYLGRPLP